MGSQAGNIPGELKKQTKLSEGQTQCIELPQNDKWEETTQGNEQW